MNVNKSMSRSTTSWDEPKQEHHHQVDNDGWHTISTGVEVHNQGIYVTHAVVAVTKKGARGRGATRRKQTTRHQVTPMKQFQKPRRGKRTYRTTNCLSCNRRLNSKLRTHFYGRNNVFVLSFLAVSPVAFLAYDLEIRIMQSSVIVLPHVCFRQVV